MTKALAPVHRPPESSGSTQAVDDLKKAVDGLQAVLLKVRSGQTLPTSGLRLFKLGDPSTDLLDLSAFANNVVPHPLGRPVLELQSTVVGAAAAPPSLGDVAALGLDPNRFVLLRVSIGLQARVRVR